MASKFDWSTYDPTKLWGKYTPFVGDVKADRDATYVGLKDEFTKGFNWQDPTSTLNLGGTTLNNPYSYAYKDPENGYAGMNGLVDDTWKEFNRDGANGLGGYAARVDSNAGGRIGLTGYIGPDGTEGKPFLAAPQGTRFYGNILQSDPKLAAKLKEYVFQGDDGELLVPDDAYKNWTQELGYWQNAPGFMTLKGLLGDTAFPVIAAALGGMAAEGAGLLGAAGEAGSVGSAFPSAAGDGFYNWATTSGLGGGGAGLGGAGGGVFNLSDPATWIGGEGLSTTGGGLGTWNAGAIPSDYFSNLLIGGTGVGAEAAAAAPGFLDQLTGYIQNQYGTPEGLAKNAASQIFKQLIGDSSGPDGSGDSIFGPLGGGSSTDSIFGNSSIFGGGGGGVSLVPTGTFWDDLFSAKNLTSLGTSVLNGVLGSSAAKNAANAQLASTEAGNAIMAKMFETNRADMEPWRQAGTFALSRLVSGLGPTGELYRNFTKADMEGDPVYQSGLDFGLSEGRKAIERRALASGGYDSGATLKALDRFATDYAGTKGNESFNRFQTQQGNQYNRLAGLAGTGQNSVNQVAALGTNTANNIAANTVSGGNARAASIVGGTNAITGGLSGFLNNLQSQELLRQLAEIRS